MPLYEIEHVFKLSQSQKHALAKAITNWHATTFNAPRFIVATRFTDVSNGLLSDTYIGGEPKKTNRLFVSLRSGTGRTPTVLASMSDSLMKIWYDIVGNKTFENELRALYIKGTLDFALEGGFPLPMPGKFEEWVKENTEVFKKLAQEGDEDFIGLVKEIDERPIFHK